MALRDDRDRDDRDQVVWRPEYAVSDGEVDAVIDPQRDVGRLHRDVEVGRDLSDSQLTTTGNRDGRGTGLRIQRPR